MKDYIEVILKINEKVLDMRTRMKITTTFNPEMIKKEVIELIEMIRDMEHQEVWNRMENKSEAYMVGKVIGRLEAIYSFLV